MVPPRYHILGCIQDRLKKQSITFLEKILHNIFWRKFWHNENDQDLLWLEIKLPFTSFDQGSLYTGYTTGSNCSPSIFFILFFGFVVVFIGAPTY
jgi:hypothetical protein